MSAPFSTLLDVSGARLHVVGRPLSSPRGALVLVPGFAEHAGRWARAMDLLAAHGYSSFTYEPRGHGQSSGPRGHTPSWSALGEDLGAVVTALEESRHLPRRRALVAASMGALVAAEWLPAHPGRFHGFVLVAPYFAPARGYPPLKVLLARAAVGVWPALAQPHGLRGRQMTRDHALAAAYDGDPALVRVMSAGWFAGMRAAQARVREAGAAGIDAPTLVLHGLADPVADPRAASEWAATATAPGSDVFLYPGMLHEPLNEMDRDRVFADLARWLDRNVLEPREPGA